MISAITLQNLTKRYGNHTVLDHLNFSIEQGELFALLWVNGAGKTTTIKMLSCLTKPTVLCGAPEEKPIFPAE